jgi:hypothetical protein
MNMSADSVIASAPSTLSGYREFSLGNFRFTRDEYFVYVRWPAPATGKQTTHVVSADAFLRAMMRDVAWGFFYGQVNFDAVFGTTNLYGQIEVYAGAFNPAYANNGLALTETFDTPLAMATFKAILEDWTNDGFDPFAAPAETGTSWLGQKQGSNLEAIDRARATCRRMPGLPGDAPLRSDASGFPVNRAFADVDQGEPELIVEPGFEHEVAAFNLFKFLSRSDVTWNPSITSVCRESLFCPTTEEYILPIKHGNDRVEWFLQFSDEITWDVEDKLTGKPRAKLTMRPGDVASMPADIRHQGYSRKRSMLLVWENANPGLPELYASGKLPPYPVEF